MSTPVPIPSSIQPNDFLMDMLCLEDLRLHGGQELTQSPVVGMEECPHGTGPAVAHVWCLYQFSGIAV